MDLDFDLDDVYIEETLLQALERSFTQLEMALLPHPEEPMVFDLGISTLALSPSLFDRLVDRCIVNRKDIEDFSTNTFLSPADMELYHLGLIEIKERNTDLVYFMGNVTTSTAVHDISITHTGRVILKLAGTMAIIESVIRQGLFSVLGALLKIVDRALLPELLAHKAPRVRELATNRLDQLAEEE